MSLPPRISQGSNVDGRGGECERRGLTYKAEAILRQAIEPGHPENPWGCRGQFRNSMTIRLLLGTGIRGMEFLNLRLPNIDHRKKVIYVRRGRDRDDSMRLLHGNVVRLPRCVPIKAPLVELIHEYIVKDRRKHEYARNHDSLAVSSHDGSPLSRAAYNNIFTVARVRVPGLPSDFSGSICRFTWNDRFSDYCDLKGVDEVTEMIIRCRIMGWTPEICLTLYNNRSLQRAAVRRLGSKVVSLGGWFDELTSVD